MSIYFNIKLRCQQLLMNYVSIIQKDYFSKRKIISLSSHKEGAFLSQLCIWMYSPLVYIATLHENDIKRFYHVEIKEIDNHLCKMSLKVTRELAAYQPKGPVV